MGHGGGAKHGVGNPHEVSRPGRAGGCGKCGLDPDTMHLLPPSMPVKYGLALKRGAREEVENVAYIVSGWCVSGGVV